MTDSSDVALQSKKGRDDGASSELYILTTSEEESRLLDSESDPGVPYLKLMSFTWTLKECIRKPWTPRPLRGRQAPWRT